MKRLFLIFILGATICYSCKQSQIASSNNVIATNGYKITRIKTINNIFIIYAQRGDTLYKILSKKEVVVNPKCEKLIIGNSYELELKSLFSKLFLGKDDLSPSSLTTVSGVDFHGTNIEIERDSIMDLFIAKNLKGLCLDK